MSEFESLTTEEILNGIKSPAFKSVHVHLIEILINHIAENQEEATKNIIPIFNTLNELLSSVSSATSNNRHLINLSLGCLINLTLSEENSILLLNHVSTLEVNPIVSWLEKYLDYSAHLEIKPENPELWYDVDEWQNMGNFLTNLCQSEEGRKIILRTSAGYMPKLAAQIRSRNPTRRRGAVASIRSCLFDQDIHWWIVNDIKIITPLVYPLVCPTPFSEREREGMDPILWLKSDNPEAEVEPDLEIMKLELECLVLLCQRRGIREELRKLKVYPIMKYLDIKIEDEEVSKVLYEVVNFLIGDEDPSTPVDTYNTSKY